MSPMANVRIVVTTCYKRSGFVLLHGWRICSDVSTATRRDHEPDCAARRARAQILCADESSIIAYSSFQCSCGFWRAVQQRYNLSNVLSGEPDDGLAL